MGSQGLEARRCGTSMSRKEPSGFEGALHSRPVRILEVAFWNRFQCEWAVFLCGSPALSGEFCGRGGGVRY